MPWNFRCQVVMLKASRPIEPTDDVMVDFRGLVAGVRHHLSGTSQRSDRRLKSMKILIVIMKVEFGGEFAQEVRQHFCRCLVDGHVVNSLLEQVLIVFSASALYTIHKWRNMPSIGRQRFFCGRMFG